MAMKCSFPCLTTLYGHRQRSQGAHARALSLTRANEWQPDIDDIRAKIANKTPGIVVINPNNPTRALYSVEVLQQIVDLAREHDLVIIDQIYDRVR